MRKYPVNENTRVAFPPFADLNAPTLEQIGQGVEDDYYLDVYTDEYVGSTVWIYDIQCELAALPSISKPTSWATSTPWKNGQIQSRPTRWETTGSLVAYRHRPPDVEVLYHGALWQAKRTLIVRRGIPVEVPWESGQTVEVYRCRIGKRFHNDTEMSEFTVPFSVYAENDEAVIA